MSALVVLSDILRGSEDGSRICWKCPACRAVHGVPVEGPAAWAWDGDVDRPTLNPSVLISEVVGHQYRCHAFVRRGVASFCTDCSHHVLGEVPIPPWDSIP